MKISQTYEAAQYLTKLVGSRAVEDLDWNEFVRVLTLRGHQELEQVPKLEVVEAVDRCQKEFPLI